MSAHIHKWDNERLALQVRSISKDLNNDCQTVLEEAVSRLLATQDTEVARLTKVLRRVISLVCTHRSDGDVNKNRMDTMDAIEAVCREGIRESRKALEEHDPR